MISYLGQLAPRQMMPMYPGYINYGPRFVRRVATQPGQPYTMMVSSEEIEKAIYKDIPTSPKVSVQATKEEPQKMVLLKNGLEVPLYLVERDIERKKAEQIVPVHVPVILPRFHKIGVFASKKPLPASLTALVLGAIVGHLFYDFKK